MNWPHPRSGIGTWARFPNDRVDEVYRAAETWATSFSGIRRPWLCWCTDERWCLFQQQLVASCGWTPVVGTDGTCPRPRVVDGAIYVDFNRELQLPVMWMHFPLEFVYLFSDVLAFWHSDVLPPKDQMLQIAQDFDSIQPGEIIGVVDAPSIPRRIRRFLRGPRQLSYINATRWFEVIGCTTAQASKSQFDSGCGWWRYPQCHPNTSEAVKQLNPHNEHGVGCWIWTKHFSGRGRSLSVNIHPYHYNDQRNNPRGLEGDRSFDTTSELFKAAELQDNYDLDALADSLGFDENDRKAIRGSRIPDSP